MYEFTESGGSWSQTAELTATGGAAGDEFGSALALWGPTALIGAGTKTVSGNTGQGAAYVFTDSGGSWSQTAELTASDGAARRRIRVLLRWPFRARPRSSGLGLTVVSGHSDQGAAYVFTSSGGSWSQTAELTAADGAAGDMFGQSVAMSGTTAMGKCDPGTTAPRALYMSSTQVEAAGSSLRSSHRRHLAESSLAFVGTIGTDGRRRRRWCRRKRKHSRGGLSVHVGWRFMD